MNIAVFLEQKLTVGGGFQQSLSVIELIAKYNKRTYNFFIYTTIKDNLGILKNCTFPITYINVTKLRKLILYLRRFLIINNISQFNSLNFIEKKLFNHKIDICYFLAPSKIPFYLKNMNFVFTVWDLSHRDMPEFPEVRNNYQFEKREFIYQNLLKKAVAIIADSEVGKKNIIRRYSVDENRVYVAQFLPSKQTAIQSKSIDIRKIYAIKGKFIFYPAQFWAHKNHIYILDSLKILDEKYGENLTVVFSGSDKGNLKYVLDYAKSLGIKEQVKYLGFIPEEHYSSLFIKSLALVMPTYFGPTNIPPLEAFKLGIPVFYSDLPEFRTDLGDAVIYIDLRDPLDLAEKLNLLLEGKLNIKEKIIKGCEKILAWRDKDYWEILDLIFNEFSIKLKTWKD